MTPRSEPLLWVQCLALGVFPLEGLLLLLLLAGSDPGPLPSLERLLCWAIGALAPAVLFWRRPPDVWSLLLVQTPLRARRELQQKLSSLQEALPLRLALVVGTLLALPLLWWLDRSAAVASRFSPIAGSPRLVALLLAATLLGTMLWQWQQLVQALWLLSRSPQDVAGATPLDQAGLEAGRLSLGLPLLLPEPLALHGDTLHTGPTEQQQPRSTAIPSPAGASATAAAVAADIPVAVEPEESTEQADGGELNQQID